MGMWDEMVLHQSMFKQRYAKKPIELTSIRFELSPSEEEARNWTMEDWRRFLDEFIREMDGISKVNHIGKKKGKAATSVKPTNIANSQYFAALHRDSKSGIPHLHLVVNRIDMDGNLNDVKFIGERAVMAAKAINQRHGWKDAMDIRQERIAEVTKACMDVLRSMPFFDWDEYADRLRAKGYDIELIRDKNGQGRVHGFRTGCRKESHRIENREYLPQAAPSANTCCSWSKTFSFCFKRYHIGQQKYGIARWSVSYKQCCQT